MILVEDSLFGLSSPTPTSTLSSSASSSSLSSPTILTSAGSSNFACSSISSSTSSTPSTPSSHQLSNETLNTAQREFFFDYNDQVAKNLLNSKEIEQFLSNDITGTNNTRSSNSHKPYFNEADLERILNNNNSSADLFYSNFKSKYDSSRHHYYHHYKHNQFINEEEDEDDEDLKYLELDLLSDSESSLEQFSALFDPVNLQNIDDNINSLSSSMSNINTIANTDTSNGNNNNCFTDIVDQSTVKSSHHLNSINNQNNNNIQQNVFNIQQQSICNHNLLSTSSTNKNISSSITVDQKNAHPPNNRPQLLRQDSQILFGSCCSSNTNTTFDSVSNYGSDGSSSTSSPSMPSTPSSIVGVSLSSFSSFSSSMPSQQHPPQTTSLISTSNQQHTSQTQSIQALPSFIEIYTSPKYSSNQSANSNLQSFIQSQPPNELNFNYINGIEEDFKIEDYLTDSEDEAENNFNLNKNLIENKSENPGVDSSPGICSASLNTQIKEKLMDTNKQYPVTMTQSSSPSSTTTTMDISIDNLPVLVSNSSSPIRSASSIKIEPNDDDNVLNPNENIKQIDQHNSIDQKNILEKKILLSNNLLFSPTSTPLSSSMAKAMRINLHNLSLNQAPAFVCLTGQDASSALYRSIDSNRSFSALNASNDISTITENSHQNIQGPQSSIVPLEQANLVYQSSVQTSGASIIVSNEPTSSPIVAQQNVNRSTYCTSSIGIANKSSRNHKTKLTSMQTCAVCGDVAACQHYGVLTCEGCKGFFKRTVQKGSKYTCLSNKDCTVDKRRRNRCQFCRFQKCLAVGMVKEVVRTDNLKGRRGRLPSKPKSPHLQESIQSPPMSTISLLLKAHNDILTEKGNLDFSQFNENIGPDINNSYRSELIDHQVLLELSSSLDLLMAFVEKIPGFTELTQFDQKSLFQNSCLELFALQMAYNIRNRPGIIILCNNTVLHRNQFMFTLGEWLPMIEELGNQLHSMNLDKNAFVCLCALTIITARDGVRDSIQIEQIENKIINSLRDHTIYNNEAQKKPNYFSRILTKLSELRTIGEYGYRIINKKVQELLIILPPNGRDKMLELERKISPINSHLSQSQSHFQSNLPLLISNNNEINSIIDNSTSDRATSSNHLEIDYPIATYFGPI